MQEKFEYIFFCFRFRPTRRPMPMPQPDYRIHEMNKRLQQRTDDSDNLWWDAFATEFFEDDANLTLTFCLEDGPKRYSKLAAQTAQKQKSRTTKSPLMQDWVSRLGALPR